MGFGSIHEFCNHSNTKLNHVKLYYSMENIDLLNPYYPFHILHAKMRKIAFHSLDVELRAPSCHITIAECGTLK